MQPRSFQRTFSAYFETVNLCIEGRAYWALLHVLVVLPDVCSAMEHADGEAKDGRYRNWCKRFLSDVVMKPEDWYRLRCLLLHQGKTRDDKGKSQYDNFRFSHPPEKEISKLHRKVETGPDGRLIHLDVKALANEVRTAVEKWFVYIKNNAPEKIVKNVERNAKALAQKAVIEEPPTTESLQTTLLSCTSSPRP